MGHDFSKVAQQLECMTIDRQLLDIMEDDVTGMNTPGASSSDEEFRTPTASRESSGSLTDLKPNTVIVFDWDDTLLCSTAINQSSCTEQELERLETACESALNAAMALGETMIVTNGNATWVRDSARRFLPKLLPTINKVQVVSARAMYESKYPGDPFMWKQAAFHHLLTKDRRFSEAGLNLVALGDQMPEIEASHLVIKSLGAPSRAKTVKLKEQPTISDIIGQLAKMELELPKLVAEDKSGHSTMVVRSSAGASVTSAAGWKLSQKAPKAFGVFPRGPRSLSLQDIWPLFS